eukprot:g6818.t1
MVTKVGNLRLYCNGKIFVGPDWKSLVVSFMLIFLPSILYLSFVAIKLGQDVFWLGFFLILFNLAMLGLTGLSNPGVIPRGPAPSGPSLALPTRTKDYQINGYTVSTKYCTTCQVYRVPRCSHCAMTDNCVEKFDHYCPWVGTCIGRRNYRFFLMFVFSGTFLCLLVCASSLSRLVQVSDNNDDEFDTALKNEPVAIALVIYTFAAVWFLGGLSLFHTYLVLTNQTTYEHIRRRFGQHGNPYNKGILMNLFEACCQPNPPYDWENDGSQTHTTRSSSRNLELPKGVVFNPTVIAMQQAVKDQAERAKKANSRRGSEVGSSSLAAADIGGLSVIRDSEALPVEYQDSIYSSCASVEGRQMGVTGQGTSTSMTQFFPVINTSGMKGVEIDQLKERKGNDKTEVSKTSSDNQISSAQDVEDSAPKMSFVGTNVDFTSHMQARRSPYQSLGGEHFKDNTVRKKHGRRSDTELNIGKGITRKSPNPFASYADEAGETDSNPLEETATLSSLTSNAASDISIHRMDRHRKTEHAVMSMEDIMSSHRSLSEISVSKQQIKQGSGNVSRNLRLGSEGASGVINWRKSGENVINNIRAFMKRPSQRSSDEKGDDISTVDQVIVDVDETRDTYVTAKREATSDVISDVSNDDKAGHKTWRPQLPVITQKKYEELKDTGFAPEGSRPKSISEDAISHEFVPSESTVVTAPNLQSSEIIPDDHPPHRIDISQFSEESSSAEKDNDPKPLL